MGVTLSVQVRLGSPRLPGEVLLILGECQILEYILDIGGEASSGDVILVAVGDASENQMQSDFDGVAVVLKYGRLNPPHQKSKHFDRRLMVDTPLTRTNTFISIFGFGFHPSD